MIFSGQRGDGKEKSAKPHVYFLGDSKYPVRMVLSISVGGVVNWKAFRDAAGFRERGRRRVLGEASTSSFQTP